MQFEPVRFSAALSLLGTALISLLALVFVWPATVIVVVSGVWAATLGVFNALFIRGQVTPNANVTQAVHDTIVSLAPYAPVITEAVVPVASSPLIDSNVVVKNAAGAPVDPR